MIDTIDDELPLVARAKFFLEAGGHVSMSEWVGLSVEIRAALVAANRVLAAERAVELAEAMSSDLARLRVQAKIDGGSGFVDALAKSAALAVQERCYDVLRST